MKRIVCMLLIALAVMGCKKSEETESADVSYAAASETAESKPAVADKAVTATPAPQQEQKIIKNADLRFETKSLDSTAMIINAAIKKYNALLQNDSQAKEYNSLTRTMTVRLPSGNFEGFVAAVSKGVSYFEKRDISADDVTEEYIDVEARMKAKKVLEERYYDMLRKANKVDDMLQIEKEISAIRQEIDAAEGKLRYIRSRVSMSTVTIAFYTVTETNEGVTESYSVKIWAAVKSGFNGLSSFFLVLLNIWPIIVIFVIAYIIYRKRIRKRKQNV
ncbi:DUF4349 domain-containing protein [Flavobacterium psychrotrophum]|uniref:DUF4349 domain-containing protein n=1 Tax=Flavobacterium psychrotrophum TaxID=2294119 RepID=UPI000E32395D|nr:DUF4349 domain-containing protein [Flavobacterium psychrotrophum]